MKQEQETLTRRSLLQRAGWAMAAAALPAWPAGTGAAGAESASLDVNEYPNPIMDKLSTYMGEAGNRELPADVSEKTKQHILDTIAAIISGVNLPPAQLAIKFARAHASGNVATIVGTNILCGSMEAAIANGMMAHSDETDDSHAPSQSHPGCGIVPAALAAGEQFGVSGTRFVRAVALGYDIGTRVTMSLGGLPFQEKSHRDTHAIANTFGASAAAGCTADLSAQQMRWLLDYAAQQASGIAAWQRDTQHIEKAFVFGGMTARNGVTAALLVQLGATGVNDIFFGPDNFLAANTPDADPTKLIDKLGVRFEVTQTNIKKWTVGSPIQAVLDALDLIIKQHPFQLDQLQSATARVNTYEATIVNNRDMPDISMQHMMAVMLVDKTVNFRSAHDKARMQDPEILRVRTKVHLVPDAELDQLYPKRIAIVDVILKDGTHYTQRVDAVRGTAQNPMTHDELVAKCRDLIAPIYGQAACMRLIDAVFNLDNIKNIRTLRPLLQRT